MKPLVRAKSSDAKVPVTNSMGNAVILAKDFDLRAGHVEVTVPWVLEGDDYSVVREYSQCPVTVQPKLTFLVCSLRRLW